jgi:hypothetical protein
MTNTVPDLTADDPAAAAANSQLLATFIGDPHRGPALQITEPGAYHFDGALDCTNPTNPLREIYLGAGVELVQTRTVRAPGDGTAYGPRFRGALEETAGRPRVRFLTADAPRGSWTITLDDATGILGEGTNEPAGPTRDMLAPGTVLYLFSDDYIHSGGKYRNVALRRVLSVAGNTITLDAPLYRNWTTARNAAAVVVNLHPSVLVHGTGVIRHANPWGNDTFRAGLLRFEFCENVTVRDITLGPGPGDGLELFSVWGAHVTPNTRHLLSDDYVSPAATAWHPANQLKVPHYGYGVLAGGGTRNFYVGGTAHHVRHSFTTSASGDVTGVTALKAAVAATGRTDTEPSKGGDPEVGEIDIRTWGTWQSSVNTHEAGNNLILRLHAASGGTWDDTTEEPTQNVASVRCADVTVTGNAGASQEQTIIVMHQNLADASLGETVVRDLRCGPTPQLIRFTGGPGGSRLRVDRVSAWGAERFLYLRGAHPFTVVGDGNWIDGTGVTTPLRRILWADDAVGAHRVDVGVEHRGYPKVTQFNGSALTDELVRLEPTRRPPLPPAA